MSMRRSLATRMFLFLPNLDSLLRAPTLFSSVFVYCTFLKFYRFYEFFWAVVILTELCMWTFIIFFRCWLLTSLHVIIHFLLFHIHGFAGGGGSWTSISQLHQKLWIFFLNFIFPGHSDDFGNRQLKIALLEHYTMIYGQNKPLLALQWVGGYLCFVGSCGAIAVNWGSPPPPRPIY